VKVRRSDSELVEEARRGSQQAFAELVARYKDAVYGVAFHRLGDFEDARDAAQEAFIKAYVQLPRLRKTARFGPWLYRMAETTALNLARGRRSHLTLEAAADLPAAASAPQDRAEQTELARQVNEALATLTEPTRLAVILRYVNGYSHDEIAAFLGASPGAVRTRLSRAKQQLRKEMVRTMGDALKSAAEEMSLSEQFLAGAVAALRAFGPPTASRTMTVKPGSPEPVKAGPDWTEVWAEEVRKHMAAHPDEVFCWNLTVGQGKFQHCRGGIAFVSRAAELETQRFGAAVRALAAGSRLALLHRLARGPASLSQLSRELGRAEGELAEDLAFLEEWKAARREADQDYVLTWLGADVVCLLWHLETVHEMPPRDS
jgi:RNA polymerase sigma-70 factor (ECF subfamily)